MDTTNSERKLWLVKMPIAVAKKWRDACQQAMQGQDSVGPELGRVRMGEGTTAEATQDRKLLLTGPMMVDVPIKEYDMRCHTSDMLPMHVFAQGQNGTISVKGKITQKYDLNVNRGVGVTKVCLDDTYRRLNRERHEAAATKTRVMQVIDDPREAKKGLKPIQGALKRKLPVKEESQKRVRSERDELERALFRLFERRPHWTFTQLQRETDQPAVWLKEVLAGVAVLNKKGPYKDQWEVKKEYRRANSAAAAVEGGATAGGS